MREVKFRAWDTEEKRLVPKNHHEEWVNITNTGDIVFGYEDG